MLIGGADHGWDRIDHYVARATELDMGARRRRGRQPDRRASPLFAGEGVRLRLRRTADIESTDVGQGNDAAVLGWLDGARLRRILLEREVGARAVGVAEVAAQTTSKVCLVQDDEVVEKLAADGAAQSLVKRVLPGRGWCREHLGDAHASHTSAETRSVRETDGAQN